MTALAGAVCPRCGVILALHEWQAVDRPSWQGVVFYCHVERPAKATP